VSNQSTNEKPSRVWLRRILEVILFCILWIPIVLSGIDNIREQIGGGQGGQWNSIGAKVSGWLLWLVGVFIWYVVISAIGRFILKKLGLLKSAEETSP
jgi:hypothetical protein